MTDPSEAVVAQSFEERTCILISNDSHKELGQTNRDDNDINRDKIHQRDLGSLSVIASLSRVSYGTWNGNKACLLGLRFQFIKGTHDVFRFDHAEVVVELTSRPSTVPHNDPEVKDYGPKSLKRAASEEKRMPYWTAKLSAKGNAGPVEVGPEIESGVQREYTRHYATEIGSTDWGDRKHRKANCVKWWMKEDKKEADGLPVEVYAAVIFTYRGLAQATVTIKTSSWFDALAYPWTADDPILLKEGIGYGPSIRSGASLDFSELTDSEWAQLVTPDLVPKDKIH